MPGKKRSRHEPSARIGLATETTRCVVCGSADLRSLRRYRTESIAGRLLFGRLTLVRCGECTLVQACPLPSDEALARYYAADYRSGGRYGSDAADVARFPRDNLFFFNRGASIAERVAPRLRELAGERPRILDVGAGYGHVLHAFGTHFPQAQRFAQEISEPCVQHLRSLGVDTTSEPFARVLEGRAFDLIVLSHVLEHLPAPADALAKFRDALAPRGLLYVEVPNIPSQSHREALDSPWAPRHDEPHVLFFDQESLRTTLERSGLAVELLDTAGPAYRRISALRYRLPPFMPTVRRVMPRRIMNVLRRQAQSRGVSLTERDQAFYTYGGRRIWLRSLSARRD